VLFTVCLFVMQLKDIEIKSSKSPLYTHQAKTVRYEAAADFTTYMSISRKNNDGKSKVITISEVTNVTPQAPDDR